MLFVDGENLTCRLQGLFDDGKRRIAETTHFLRDVFAWFQGRGTMSGFVGPVAFPNMRETQCIRCHYYTSCPGDQNKLDEVRARLRKIGFDPQVFKRNKNGRSKGVDISLTKDMLSHAFRDNYDVAILVAGDGDYLPLIDEVKRLGKIVRVAFLTGEKSGLSSEVQLAADHFIDLAGHFATDLQFDSIASSGVSKS